MMEWTPIAMGPFLFFIYLFCILCILAYSLAQGHLLLLYLRSRRKESESVSVHEPLPHVTVQLPVYNEPLVVERFIRSVAAFDYPKELLEIQVLDDSTDETVETAASVVSELRSKGIDIYHVRRDRRAGFKAGALEYGMSICKGEFIAIFDADFLPEKDFLHQTLGFFSDASIGAVQTRWAHLNRSYNLLTRLLAVGLDAHFTIEQRGRNAGGNFINFNGTAGIWRKTCIVDAGGWSADTLTEDLDLSYRAQLKGWRIQYKEEYQAPAEIPMLLPAIRSQQYRWNKGGAEVARKQLWNLLGSSIPLHTRLHGLFHLLNTAVFILVFLAAVLSVPLLLWLDTSALRDAFLMVGTGLFFGITVIAMIHWVSIRQRSRSFWSTLVQYIYQFPLFLCVSMGLSLFNSIAVLEGWMGRKSPFVRTPKYASVGVEAKGDESRWGWPPLIAWVEGGLAAYFVFGAVMAFQMGYYPFLMFHIMLTIGFSVLFFYSAKHGTT